MLEVFCSLCRYQARKKKGTVQNEFYMEHQGLERPDFFMETFILFEAFLFTEKN